MNSRMHLNLAAPPRNPTQVPPDMEDTIGKHDEGEFNEGGESEDFGDDADDDTLAGDFDDE